MVSTTPPRMAAQVSVVLDVSQCDLVFLWYPLRYRIRAVDLQTNLDASGCARSVDGRSVELRIAIPLVLITGSTLSANPETSVDVPLKGVNGGPTASRKHDSKGSMGGGSWFRSLRPVVVQHRNRLRSL
jgi:hypothetical protein